MRFVFDENHPPPLARMLAPLVEGGGHSVARVVSPGLRGTPASDLLAAICAGGIGGVLATAGRAMRGRKHEKAAVVASGAVVAAGVANWNQAAGPWDRARCMLWWWPTIAANAREAVPGTFLELPWSTRTAPPRRWRVGG